MTFLPILRRELAVASRRTATYRQRVIFAGLAIGTVVVMFFTMRISRLTGGSIFHVMAWGGFLLCALEGMRATADSISLERREGTLGLLLLTDLSGREIVLGKVAASAVQSVTVVVAMLPAFALPLLIGGVTAGECWRVMLTFIATLLFTLTAGMAISAWATHTLVAFMTSLGLILAITLPPMAVTFLPAAAAPRELLALGGPLAMFVSAMDADYAPSPGIFWGAFAACVTWSALLFVTSGFILERWPRLEVRHRETWWQRLLRPRKVRAESWGGGTAQSSPAVWLAVRTLPGQRVLWVVVVIGAALCFLLGGLTKAMAVPSILLCEIFFAYLIKLWLAAVAPQSLNLSRRSGALELLLCTPLTAEEIVRGQVDALYGYFITPALAVACGFPIAGIAGMGLLHNEAGLRTDGSMFAMGLFWFVLFILDLHALAYAGLWFGLTNARVDRAISKTAFGVLLLPWITLVVPLVGCVGIIGWPIFWMTWASGRLKSRLREEATTIFSVEEERSGWFPWSRP